MSSPSLTNKALSGFLWLLSGKGVQAALQIIVVMILARLLTPHEFGVVGAALVVVGLSQIFSELGVGSAIVQSPRLSQSQLHAGFTLSILLSCVVGCTIAWLAPQLATLFRMPGLEPVVRVLALLFPIAGSSVIGEAALKREMRFRDLMLVQLTSYVIGYGFVGITFGLLGWGVWALVFAQLGQVLVNASIVLVIKREVVGFTARKAELAPLLSFGVGLSLAQIANYSARQSDNLVVGRWLGADALGIYGRAYQFLMTPTNLFGSVSNQVLFPAMASVQGDKERLARAYTRSLALVAMITLPLSGVLIVLAPEIVAVLLGAQWGAVVTPFQILAVFLLFRTSYKISDSLVRALGAIYRSAWRQWVYAAAVTLGAWLGHFFGLNGVAFGVGSAVCLHFVLMLDLGIRISGASWRTLARIHAQHFAVAVIVTVVTWSVASFARDHQLHSFLVLVIGGLFSLLTMILVLRLGRSYFREEVDWISMAIKQRFQKKEGHAAKVE